MRNLSTKISLALIILGLGLGQKAKAQSFEDIMAMGITDANTYLENYAKPMMLSFNNGLSSGWYNTAKPHKLLGFDLTLTVNIANIPNGDRRFNFDDQNWQNIGLNSVDRTIPTAVGGDASPGNLFIQNGVQLTDGTTGTSFSYGSGEPIDIANGFDVEDLPIAGFPVPALTLGLGLPKNTELKFRYGTDGGALGDDGSIKLIGAGVMHDIKQWIPGLKQVPFDLSGFVSYVSLNAEFPINVQTTSGTSSFDGSGDVTLKASSFTFQGVISKKLSILTPYVGLGYNVGSSNLSVNGNYTYSEEVAPGQVLSETFTDPVNLDFSGGSSPRLNAGLRIKLLILTIHAEYAIQKYRTFTAGVGLSIR